MIVLSPENTFDVDVEEDIVIFGKKLSVSCVVSRICVNGPIILSQESNCDD